MNNIDTSLLLSNYQKEKRKTGSDILGKDDFLKILMTQLQNQDPSNPLQDKDFIAQMATFSTLEQITNMGKSINKFVEVQEQNKMISYSQFVGKDITWHKMIESTDSNAEPTVQEGQGRIQFIKFNGNDVIFTLDDGTELEPANISQVNEMVTESNMLQASMLIGKKVTYINENQEEVSAIVNSVSFKNGQTIYQLEDGVKKITSNQIVKIG